MPELPDLVVYLEALAPRLQGQPVRRIRLRGPALLRTVEPPLSQVTGRRVTSLRLVGKRLGIGLEGDLWLALHLMIAGRLHWRPPGATLQRRGGLLAIDFPDGTLTLTERGSKQRASLHVIQGEAGLTALDRGGLEVLTASPAEFAAALRRENRTLKRALTDPRIVSGVGNAYSDEILHRARCSPLQRTGNLGDDELQALHGAAVAVLTEWIERLRAAAGDAFPEKVTAFRPEMAVHGRYRKPCPDCGAPVQRIRYSENECNYCPACQTGGKLLRDRARSRLLRDDWPRTLEEL